MHNTTKQDYNTTHPEDRAVALRFLLQLSYDFVLFCGHKGRGMYVTTRCHRHGACSDPTLIIKRLYIITAIGSGQGTTSSDSICLG